MTPTPCAGGAPLAMATARPTCRQRLPTCCRRRAPRLPKPTLPSATGDLGLYADKVKEAQGYIADAVELLGTGIAA